MCLCVTHKCEFGLCMCGICEHMCECIMDLCAHLLMDARGIWVFCSIMQNLILNWS